MCCFSRPIPFVARTKIFARMVGQRQRLAYAMSFAAAEAVAMVLPLPVPPGSADDAVRFLDLTGYRTFFTDLEAGFPLVMPVAARGGSPYRGGIPARPKLVVHDIGDFVASFVPTAADFDRLDPRFRLPPSVLGALRGYDDWGFAVVQLKPSMRGLWARLRRTRNTLAPVALELPTRDPSRLFFPTVHVHDGAVHAEAAFDHTLYWQLPPGVSAPPDREPVALGLPRNVSGPAGRFMDVERARGLVDGELPCHRRVLWGTLPNQDTWISLAEPARPRAAA